MPDQPQDHQETRLQTVERDVATIRTEVAVAARGAEDLARRVEASYDRLAEKLDLMVAPWVAKVEEVEAHVKAQAEKIGEHAGHLERLVARDLAKVQWRAGLRKAAVTVLTGVVAICAKELVVWAFLKP